MAYSAFQNQCAMNMSQSSLSSCAMSDSTLLATASGDLQPNTKGLAAVPGLHCFHSQGTAFSRDAGHMQFTPSSAQLSAFGIHGNTAVPSSHDYQNLFAGLAHQNAAFAFTPSVSMTSLPGELQSNPVTVSRSNKMKEKIQQLHPFYSRRLTSAATLEGKTRTRDKYRVVYAEKQRVGLEKAYKEDKFITMAKKAELSKTLGLSDRQIKIWFQNRRAKERRDKGKSSSKSITASPELATEPCKTAKRSCRFEKENVGPSNQQNASDYPSLQIAVQPGYRNSDYRPYDGYDQSLMPQTSQLSEAEATSNYPDFMHARSPMSPPEWMNAYHQTMLTTVNVSPFTSSLDVGFSSRY